MERQATARTATLLEGSGQCAGQCRGSRNEQAKDPGHETVGWAEPAAREVLVCSASWQPPLLRGHAEVALRAWNRAAAFAAPPPPATARLWTPAK